MQNADLHWTIAIEVNTYGFEIVCRIVIQIIGFTPNAKCAMLTCIGFVEWIGNSNYPKQYIFVDRVVSTGWYYSHMNQMDCYDT